MKVLLDHCLPRRLAESFSEHEVRTAGEMGWDRLRNGDLLAAGAAGGFDVMVTIDKKIRHEQHLPLLPLAVVVIMSRTNRLEDLVAFVPGIEGAIRSIVPRTLVEVGKR